MSNNHDISAEELDMKFDAGEDISAHLGWSKARRPGREQLVQVLRETKERLLDEVQRVDWAIQQIENGSAIAKS